MDGYMHYWNWWTFPFFGGMMFFWFILFLVIGFLVYQDANKRGMNGLLWFILVILPMVGWIFLVIYLIVRETQGKESRALEILKERLAKGEITEEEFRKLKEELEK
ncbi:SHOCT domain-containing protein [Archaeoglobus neptunius]|uniref:SHOCT domain-containing protein n=1 Tax=Archaeoglobus neptunius TaxID=2798580 RepID=UPI0019259152|nr:SHOCT domain-containing protein [Archaeoglobus neptunius]